MDKSVACLHFADDRSSVTGGSLNRIVENLTNLDTIDNDIKRVFWASFPMFSISTTVFYILVKGSHP